MKRYAVLFSFLFASIANLNTTAKAQAVNETDSLALVDLYNSTNGAAWIANDNWLAGPVKNWYGITVTGTRVTRIDLPFNNLSGAIPASIVHLAMLQFLDLEFNDLSGAIPADIGKLSNLTDLYLSSNQLTGTIPASIARLVNLKTLYLDYNQLSGSLPSAIGNLTKLEQLQLEMNEFSGSIPASIGKLTNLVGLYLNYNQLTGNIPFLGKSHSLADLYLDHNQLTGSIPEYFRYLKNLFIVNLSYNQLSQKSNAEYPMAQPRQNGYRNISNNHNTFDGLEFIANKIPQVIYAPQAVIPLHQHGSTLAVYAGGTLSNNTYKWFKVGKTGSTTVAGDSIFTPTESGKYYVQVKNTMATRLTLYSDTINFTLNSFTASRKLTPGVISSSIKQKLQVSPNPASSIIQVKISGTADIVLTNESGTTLLTKSISNSTTINVSSLANGIYYVQNKKTGEVQKIIVSH